MKYFFIIFFSIYKNGNQNLSEEEKKYQYHRERNKNLSEEQKQKQVEYMRSYYLTHKK